MSSNGSEPLSSSPPLPSAAAFSFSPPQRSWSSDAADAWTSPSKIRSSSPLPPPATSLFAESSVPPLYSKLWLTSDPTSTGYISLSTLERIISSSGVTASNKEKIISLVSASSSTSRIGKQDFFVAIALTAFAQRFAELSVEKVEEMKDDLPIPSLPNSIINPPPSGNGSNLFGPVSARPSPAIRSSSEASLDPWNTGGRNGGVGSGAATGAVPPSFNHNTYSGGFSPLPEDDVVGDVGEAFGENLLSGGGLGYGSEGWELAPLDKVHVNERDELGGWILQHTVWICRSDKHSSLVERRFSDFVWLLECLTKRYPFRLLPSLPPKRVAISGRYLAADDLFLERRRRGLERFLTFLVNHPIFKVDALVGLFLTDPSDLVLIRKSNSISLIEESYSRTLTTSEESSLPLDLEEKLNSIRGRILPLVENWTKVQSIIDRIVHRRQNQGADWCRLKIGLESGLEIERSGWRTVEVESVEEAAETFSKGVGTIGQITEDCAGRHLEGFVEDIKRHREIYLNMRDLFGRQVYLSPDSVDKLKKRVESNMRKLELIREVKKPNYEVELDKLASVIESDQSQIDTLLRRRTFIKYCLWQEVLWMFRFTSLLKVCFVIFVNDEIRFSEDLGQEGWKSLKIALNS